jgi:hypothetical protein
MKLPTPFQFSQSSLQDYVDCRRRFQLRYLERLSWPAVEAEPALENERHLRQGARFHHMIQQHMHGVPSERLSKGAVDDPALLGWWEGYLRSLKDPLVLGELKDMQTHPEITLSAPLGDHRLIAKYDLIAVEAGKRVVIVDWKTSLGRSPRTWLEKRLQTHVYPYLLVLAGTHLNQGNPIQPEQVEMVYWFARHPDQPARFPYSADRFQEDQTFLTDLIDRIARLEETEFFKTDHLKRCEYCVYRSLCDRGETAGEVGVETGLQERADFEFDLDFDQIAEIEF